MGDSAIDEVAPNLLRNRSHKRDKSPKLNNGERQAKHETVWGKTPGGTGTKQLAWGDLF
jgi:hypothetical protein